MPRSNKQRRRVNRARRQFPRSARLNGWMRYAYQEVNPVEKRVSALIPVLGCLIDRMASAFLSIHDLGTGYSALRARINALEAAQQAARANNLEG